MPDDLQEIRDRLKALEARQETPTYPIPLATDLDDLGAVKTFLEMEEPTAAPDTPPVAVARLYLINGAEGSRIVYKDEAGLVLLPFCTTDSEVQFIQGSESLTISSGTRAITGTVTHNRAWSTVGRVYLTIQDANTLAAGEKPISAEAYTVQANDFSIDVNCHANVAANRGVTVGWLATGVL